MTVTYTRTALIQSIGKELEGPGFRPNVFRSGAEAVEFVLRALENRGYEVRLAEDETAPR